MASHGKYGLIVGTLLNRKARVEEFATALGVYVTICGLLWTGFVRLEKLLKEDTVKSIAKFVCGEKSMEHSERWPAVFAELFDRVFKKKNSHRVSFTRSCMASLMALIVTAGIFILAFPEQFSLSVGLLAFGVIFNFVPDYLSLLETRYVLGRMAGIKGGFRRKTPPGIFGLTGWLIFDAAATLAIFLFCAGAFILLTGGSLGSFLNLFWAGLLLPWTEQTATNSFVGVFIYTTFCTSVWIWLYVGAGLLMRLLSQGYTSRRFLDKHLRVRERPLSVMGAVLIGVFTVTFWPYYLLNWTG